MKPGRAKTHCYLLPALNSVYLSKQVNNTFFFSRIHNSSNVIPNSHLQLSKKRKEKKWINSFLLTSTKGQIISKAIFVFLTSPKKRTKKWKKLTWYIKSNLFRLNFWRILDTINSFTIHPKDTGHIPDLIPRCKSWL